MTDPGVPAVVTLRNVLELERRRQFDNRAVVGGLSALVERLQEQFPLGPALRVRLSRYGALDPAGRAALVEEISLALESQAETPSPPPSPRGSGGPALSRSATGGSAEGWPTSAIRTPPSAALSPTMPLSALQGVGPARAKRLAALGLLTADDLRYHFPHRYLLYPPPRRASELGFEELASFEGTVAGLTEAALPGNKRRTTALLRDTTGMVAAVWIRAGRWPLGIREGMRLAVSGHLVRYGRQISFENPDYEPADHPPLHTRGIVPVYPLTAGISQLVLRSLVRDAIHRLPAAEEDLPAWLRAEETLLGKQEAIGEIHAPTSSERLAGARHRLAFDELLPIELLVLQRRQEYQSVAVQAIEAPWGLLAEFRRGLPFVLTRGQQRAISMILEDMAKEQPMARLLQGDVGSGKTVVAAMALLAMVANGGQGALVAPTEILAEQHLRTLTDLWARSEASITSALGHPLRMRLLSGALSRKQREETLATLAAGETDVVVGTHAVLEPDVEFRRLALAVVDEQHRFGVHQRVALRRKGPNPHLLVMTATPIPRTLALTMYGDLDLSLIEDMPPGRQPVDTILLQPEQRTVAYERVRSEVALGHQAFVICPLVEESEAVEARAATEEYERLSQGDLAGLRLALLHGRIRAAQKDETMRAFARGDYDVLVATPVVEVGVDVPNATVMLVEGAERFGLAQLHQFRGRVGRGTAPASCFMVAGGNSTESLARLEAIARSSNGLELAEEDLRVRGPGEYFGMRQSGFPAFRLADITDLDFVQRVREAAGRLLARDQRLDHGEHGRLAEAVHKLAAQITEAN